MAGDRRRAAGERAGGERVLRGVSAASLFAWRRRLRPVAVEQLDKPLGPAASVSFVEVKPPSPIDDVRLTAAATRPIELELRNGRRVLVLYRGFDVTLLRDVLAALESGLPGRSS